MTLGERRRQFDSPAVDRDRIGSPTLPLDRDAQIELRLGEIVLQGDRQLKAGLCLVDLTGAQMRPAERVPQFGVVGVELYRQAQSSDRGRRLVCLKQPGCTLPMPFGASRPAAAAPARARRPGNPWQAQSRKRIGIQ